MPPNTQSNIDETISYKRFTRTLSDISSKPRTRTYTMIIFSLIAIMLLGWFAIRPTVNTIIKLRREIADKSELNKKMDAKIASLIEAQNNYNAVQSRLHLIDQAVPEDPDIINFVSALRQIETQSNLKATVMDFKNVDLASTSGDIKKKLLEEIPAASAESGDTASDGKQENGDDSSSASVKTNLDTISIQSRNIGAYGAVRSFLEAIAGMRRLTNIDVLDIKAPSSSATENGTIGGDLQVSLNIEAFYRLMKE